MDGVARLAQKDRADLFNESAAQRGLNRTIIEKDFWVCWVLKRLSDLPVHPRIVFKGGTSLSKVFGVIHRFSEDIDLSFDRRDLGFDGDRDPANAPSGNQARKRIDDLTATVQRYIAETFRSQLAAAIRNQLGSEGESWRLLIDDHDQQTVMFHYPHDDDHGAQTYIVRAVRLELGARGDPWPTIDGTVTPYAADDFPALFGAASCHIETLAAERTFWEKATLLHQYHHWPEAKPAPERPSRHYYDLAQLADTKYGTEARERLQLLAEVVAHKRLYFGSTWARYETACPGTLKLVPLPERLQALGADYTDMQREGMFFKDAPPFEKVIDRLRNLERQINKSAEAA